MILRILKIDHPGRWRWEIPQDFNTARVAGRCDREVGALRPPPFILCFFFGWPKQSDLPLRLPPMPPRHTFFLLEIPSQSIFADRCPHGPHTAHSFPGVLDATSLALGPHSPSYAVTEGFLIVGARLLFSFRRFPTLFTVTQILSIWGYKNQTHTVTHIAER